ncbi:MAG: coiled coil domain-containing protein [Acidobacteriota bacterium]
MMESKKSYQERMEAQLNQWSVKIDTLLARAEKDARTGCEKLTAGVRDKQQAAQGRLRELRGSSSEAWQDLKPGLEKAWGELKDAFQKAADRF